MKRLSLGGNWTGTESEILISDKEIIVLEKAQNVTPLLDQNLQLRNAGGGRRRGLHHIARVDAITHHNWKKEWKQKYSDKWEWKTYLAMKLRDRDYSKFRTSDMKA